MADRVCLYKTNCLYTLKRRVIVCIQKNLDCVMQLSLSNNINRADVADIFSQLLGWLGY